MSIFSGKTATATTAVTGGAPSGSQATPTPITKDEGGNAPQDESCIGPGMTIVGQVVSEGVVKLFGRMEGELRASVALICDAAQFDGTIVAQELTISGHVKGTIHATRVKLNSSAVVLGDIFHRSLSIEENAQFEGSSRRQENPTGTLSGAQEKAPDLQPQALLGDSSSAHDGSPFEEVVSSAT